jgi:peptidoglycan/xylan/chitin deacetylase (PgdA/CDA1 family)
VHQETYISGKQRVKVPLKKRLKSILGGVAGAAGLYTRSFRSKMCIIAFHRVNDQLPEDGLTCSSAKFAAFCRFFHDNFRVLSLAQQIAAVRAGENMGGTLSITFDDGYLDNFEVAAPILRALGLPATFFITTGFIETNVVPLWDRQLSAQPGWMQWDQVRALARQGFEIGCHTDSHIDMGTADSKTVRNELEVSMNRLYKELGTALPLFAYPFGGRGNISTESLALVREMGFMCCASCYGGTNEPAEDPFNLKRIPVAEWFATPHQFGYELLMGRL